MFCFVFLGLNFHENKIENETICRLHFTMCSNLFEIYQNPPVICANSVCIGNRAAAAKQFQNHLLGTSTNM